MASECGVVHSSGSDRTRGASHANPTRASFAAERTRGAQQASSRVGTNQTRLPSTAHDPARRVRTNPTSPRAPGVVARAHEPTQAARSERMYGPPWFCKAVWAGRNVGANVSGLVLVRLSLGLGPSW